LFVLNRIKCFNKICKISSMDRCI